LSASALAAPLTSTADVDTAVRAAAVVPILTAEQGKPLAESAREVHVAAAYFRYYAEMELEREVHSERVRTLWGADPSLSSRGHRDAGGTLSGVRPRRRWWS
jgi:acyl-CoA reductase-like NAD-dependent aldehyde dehydrogenase